jgi:hypothetical protein
MQRIFLFAGILAVFGLVVTGCAMSTDDAGVTEEMKAATQLVLDEWTDGRLDAEEVTAAGSKWYTFTATTSSPYIHVDAVEGTEETLTDLFILLYDSKGKYLTSKRLSGMVRLNATRSSRHYVKILPYSGTGYGDYRISYTASTLSNDELSGIAGATVLTANTWTDGNITTEGGEQWFKFTMTSVPQYIHVGGTLTDLNIQLYDSNGKFLNRSILSTRVNVTQGSMYFIKLLPYRDDGHGEYNIMFTASVDTPDVMNAATPLTLNQWSTGALDAEEGSGVESKWFKFTATAPVQYIHAGTAESTPLTNVTILLCDSEGKLINSYRLDARVDVTQGSMYFFKLSPYSNTGRGNYKIAFNASESTPELLAAMDAASALTANAWTSDSLAAGGEDWFQFTASAVTQYIHVTSSLSDLYIQLYDSHNNKYGTAQRLTPSGGVASTAGLSVTRGNTYFFKLWSGTDGVNGSYTITFNASTTSPTTP